MKIFITFIYLSFSLSAFGIDEGMAKNTKDLRDLLINKVEILELSHEAPTKIHPRANLTVNYNKDFRIKKEEYLNYYKNALAGNSGETNIERYAGIHSESNFSFSLRIERSPTSFNYDIEKIVEVVTEGDTLNDKQLFQSKVTTFESRKVANITMCAGYLYKGVVQGPLKRLYRNKEKKYTQAKFSCKTLTRPLCNAVYRMEDKNYNIFKYERSALHDRLEDDVLDAVNYQIIQKKNMKELKVADIPGGRRSVVWPRDPALHHYKGIGEDQQGLTRKEFKWLVGECKNKMAYFHDPFIRIDNSKRRPGSAGISQGTASRD